MLSTVASQRIAVRHDRHQVDTDMRLLLEWVFENALDEDKSGFLEEREANRVAKYCGYGGPDGDITALWTRC